MTSFAAQTSAPLRGDLRITVRDSRTGELLRRFQIRNTITQNALRALVKLLAQKATTAASQLRLSELRVGTGTVPPVRTNTSLGAQVASVPLLDENLVLALSDPFEVKVIATLEGSSVPDGTVLTEAALYLAGDGEGGAPWMFSRQIHPGIAVNGALSVDYDWRIAFTA